MHRLVDGWVGGWMGIYCLHCSGHPTKKKNTFTRNANWCLFEIKAHQRSQRGHSSGCNDALMDGWVEGWAFRDCIVQGILQIFFFITFTVNSILCLFGF